MIMKKMRILEEAHLEELLKQKIKKQMKIGQ
jgi:hypothetical protein